jgi:hypothetical protein
MLRASSKEKGPKHTEFIHPLSMLQKNLPALDSATTIARIAIWSAMRTNTLSWDASPAIAGTIKTLMPAQHG